MKQDAPSAAPAPPGVHPDTTITVQIVVPANNSNVPGGGTFTTYGYCDPNAGTTKTAQVTDGTNTWNGTAAPIIPHTPAYRWAFQFTGLPLNKSLLLTVKATDGMGNSGSDTITITCVT